MTEQEIETTKASFFASIRADPKNNDNRLIFADWCEEQGLSELAAMLRGGSRKFISELAQQIGNPFDTFDDLMAHVESCMNGGDFFTEHDSQYKRDTWYDHVDEFWKHYEVMTGVKHNEDDYTPVFNCSC